MRGSGLTIAVSGKYGLPAYKVGINVVIYAMSH